MPADTPPPFNPAQPFQLESAPAFDPSKPFQPEKRRWRDVPGEAISNIPESGGRFLSDIGHAIAHPIDTAKNIGRIGVGAAQEVFGKSEGRKDYRPHAEAAARFYKERYGSEEGLKNAIATDPVGVLADFSTFMTGGGSVLRGAAALDRAAGATRAADIAAKVGETAQIAGRAVDPLKVPGTLLTGAKKVVMPDKYGQGVSELQKADIKMTPGQRAGKGLRDVEAKVAALPLVGAPFQYGRKLSFESFNESVANQALAPIGQTLDRGTTAGREMIGEVRDKLGAAYDRLLPSLTFTPDGRLLARIRRIYSNRIKQLPPSRQQQFMAMVRDYGNRSYPMTGSEYKILESEIAELASHYGRAQGDEGRMGAAFERVHEALAEALERQNPGKRGELQRINTGYAIYKRMEDAANRRLKSDGVFSSTDLMAAIKGASKRGVFARGDARLQKLAEAASRVLPTDLPESGTPGGHIVTNALLGAGGAHYAGADPRLAAATGAGLLTAGALYTRPGMSAVDKAVKHRRGLQAARQAAFQAGRLDEQQQDQQQSGLRFTVPGRGPRDMLAPPQDALGP